MVQAKPRFLTFEDYLVYTDETETLCELFNGELVPVPPESGQNVVIVDFLFLCLARLVDFRQVRRHGLELEVRGEPRNRYPDLTIIRPEHIPLLAQRNTIRLTMPPPLLVVEVVSPGELQRERDYVAKRLQYEAIGIPEYWIIDPERQTVTVLVLHGSQYQEHGVFRGEGAIASPGFPQFQLTANQILTASGQPSD